MAIFELAPALEISRKIVREQANKAVLRLVPDIKQGAVAPDRTFGIFLGAIFTAGLLALLVINTALAKDAFVLKDLKQQAQVLTCLLYTSPSPRDRQKSRMPSSA